MSAAPATEEKIRNMKPTITWIVVADHQCVKTFENNGPGRGLSPVGQMTFETRLEPSREINTDRPGRKPAQGGAVRSMTPATDPHRAAGEAFVAQIAQSLTDAARENNFRRLILIAPPRALGELRKALPDTVRALVSAEIDEDLTKHSQADLTERLGDYLAV